MRMKFLRILPETCARTWCLFSNSTRNIAFGSGSITVAITSIASSLGTRLTPHSHAVYNIQDVLGYFSNRTHSIDLAIHAFTLIKADQRVSFAIVCLEALLNEVFTIIRAVN